MSCTPETFRENPGLNVETAISELKVGEALVSTIIPGDLAIPVLNNIHHVWPHVVTDESGAKQLYLLVHGWNRGKFAVLKQISE